jgi:hypothetical protein
MRDLFRLPIAAEDGAAAREPFFASSGMPSVMPVRIGPGQMQLTVMPSRPSSTASASVCMSGMAAV